MIPYIYAAASGHQNTVGQIRIQNQIGGRNKNIIFGIGKNRHIGVSCWIPDIHRPSQKGITSSLPATGALFP